MTDHDQLFKTLLKEFFREFVALFLPAVHTYLDATGITFLDKEVFSKLPVGLKRQADLVARVKFKGAAAHFLLHIEPESARKKRRGAFARRMFDYFALLTRDYKLPVYPVALLSYDSPRNAEADVFRIVFPDKQVLEFRFTVIQLNRLNWRDYLRQDNPVASALMAKMGVAPDERVKVKMECLRMILRLRLDRDKMRFLAKFVDTYLALNAEEEQQFQTAIKALPRKEREETMEFMSPWETSWEKRGYYRGLEKTVIRQLELRFGKLSQQTQTNIQRLAIEKLESLAEALLYFASARDLTQWLREHGTDDKSAAKISASRNTNGRRA